MCANTGVVAFFPLNKGKENFAIDVSFYHSEQGIKIIPFVSFSVVHIK